MSEETLGCSALIRSICAAPDVRRISIAFEDPAWVVSVELKDDDLTLRGLPAASLTRALGAAHLAVTRDEPITARHARDRAKVRLPNGNVGTLWRVTLTTRRATVRTNSGGWAQCNLDDLRLIEESDASLHL